MNISTEQEIFNQDYFTRPSWNENENIPPPPPLPTLQRSTNVLTLDEISNLQISQITNYNEVETQNNNFPNQEIIDLTQDNGEYEEEEENEDFNINYICSDKEIEANRLKFEYIKKYAWENDVVMDGITEENLMLEPADFWISKIFPENVIGEINENNLSIYVVYHSLFELIDNKCGIRNKRQRQWVFNTIKRYFQLDDFLKPANHPVKSIHYY